jgi:Uma2 family endonuclease
MVDTVQPIFPSFQRPARVVAAKNLVASDFIVEIASSSTAPRDREEKRRLYQYELPEYWIADPTPKRSISLLTSITI